jgi:hypothetical protein
MALKIEVKSNLVTEISGVSKAGKPYHMKKQSAWAYTYDQQGHPNPYPERIELSIADGQDPYPAGMYHLSDQCIYVGDFNSLTIGRLIMTPAPAAAVRAAS